MCHNRDRLCVLGCGPRCLVPSGRRLRQRAAETGRTEADDPKGFLAPLRRIAKTLFVAPGYAIHLAWGSVDDFGDSSSPWRSVQIGEEMLRTWVIAGIALAASTGPTLGQDAAAGEQVFKRLCSPCQRHRWPQERHLRGFQLLASPCCGGPRRCGCEIHRGRQARHREDKIENGSAFDLLHSLNNNERETRTEHACRLKMKAAREQAKQRR